MCLNGGINKGYSPNVIRENKDIFWGFCIPENLTICISVSIVKCSRAEFLVQSSEMQSSKVQGLVQCSVVQNSTVQPQTVQKSTVQ